MMVAINRLEFETCQHLVVCQYVCHKQEMYICIFTSGTHPKSRSLHSKFISAPLKKKKMMEPPLLVSTIWLTLM